MSGFDRHLTSLRFFLIRLLAGKDQIGINLLINYSGSALYVRDGQKALIIGCGVSLKQVEDTEPLPGGLYLPGSPEAAGRAPTPSTRGRG